eukprot:1732062-Prymnesium_polylepis.1
MRVGSCSWSTCNTSPRPPRPAPGAVACKARPQVAHQLRSGGDLPAAVAPSSSLQPAAWRV